MALIGCTTRTIPIVKAVEQHFEDIGQDPELHDVAYENSQARERTQIIMDVANQIGGLALGTGDLSELALGWCTYNGDQMSMYNMSASVPKTLIRHLVRYAGAKLGGEIAPVVEDILDTPISPELIPSKAGELTQRTEDTLGAYALHDFFLYHMMDSGASPLKLYPLAKAAFDGQYADDAILAALRTFVRRFFTCRTARRSVRSAFPRAAIGACPRTRRASSGCRRSSSSNASTPETGARNCRQRLAHSPKICYHFLNYIGRTFAFRPAAYRRRIFHAA